jgi:hypothetical protein
MPKWECMDPELDPVSMRLRNTALEVFVLFIRLRLGEAEIHAGGRAGRRRGGRSGNVGRET